MQRRRPLRSAAACLLVLSACGGDRSRPNPLVEPDGPAPATLRLSVAGDSASVQRSRLEGDGVLARVIGSALPVPSTLSLFGRTDRGRIVYVAQLPIQAPDVQAEFTVRVGVGELQQTATFDLVARLLAGKGQSLTDSLRLRLR